MTPAAIIKKASADGVILALSPAGTIKATGEPVAVTRWLPIIREHKTEIVAALQGASNSPIDPEADVRRERVLAMLEDKPESKCALLVDKLDTDPVLLTLAIRGQATCELACPKAKFDPFELLAMLDRYSSSIH